MAINLYTNRIIEQFRILGRGKQSVTFLASFPALKGQPLNSSVLTIVNKDLYFTLLVIYSQHCCFNIPGYTTLLDNDHLSIKHCPYFRAAFLL